MSAMKCRVFAETIAAVFEQDEELIGGITDLCSRLSSVKAASVQGTGCLKQAALSVFDAEKKEKVVREVSGSLQIASLCGNLSTLEGKPFLNAGAVIADDKGAVYAGTLERAVVSADAEIMIRVFDGIISREYSDALGKYVMKF